MRDILIKVLSHRGADTQQGGRTSPYDPRPLGLRTIYGNRQLVPTTRHRVHKHLHLIQPIIIQFRFRNPQKCVTNTTGPAGQRGNKYSQPSNKGLGKKASSHIHTQPSVADIFARTSTYPQSRKPR